MYTKCHLVRPNRCWVYHIAFGKREMMTGELIHIKCTVISMNSYNKATESSVSTVARTACPATTQPVAPAISFDV